MIKVEEVEYGNGYNCSACGTNGHLHNKLIGVIIHEDMPIIHERVPWNFVLCDYCKGDLRREIV